MPATGPTRPRSSRRTSGGSRQGSRSSTRWTSRRATDMDTETAEPAPELTTLADLPFHVLGRHPKPLLIGQVRAGTVVGVSTRDWFDQVRDLSLGLGALGIGKGDRVVIMSESRPEWLLADLAALTLGAVVVPVYSTLTGGQARYIIKDAAARLAFVS